MYNQQYQNKINMLQQQQQTQQQVNITPEMQQIALQTEQGQKAYQDWLTNKDILLTQLLRQVPEGAIAFNKLQDELLSSYNHYIVSNIQSKPTDNETEQLRKQNAELMERLNKLEQAQTVAIQQPLKGGNK